MFLKTVMERNQPLVRLGIEWQQNGVILPDTYLLDYDTILENARSIKQAGDANGVQNFFMLKQIGRNPLIARALTDMGYVGAVCVDFREALTMVENQIPLGNVGHLVQIPRAALKKILRAKPVIVTVYTLEKAREISAVCTELGLHQKLMLRVLGEGDMLYSGQYGGFELQELDSAVRAIEAMPNVEVGGVCSFPCFLYDEAAQDILPMPNLRTVQTAAEMLRARGYRDLMLNTPSATCTHSIPMIAAAGGTHGEPGHGLTGTTPYHAGHPDAEERPGYLYVSEVSHNLGDKAYCYGGHGVPDTVLCDPEPGGSGQRAVLRQAGAGGPVLCAGRTGPGMTERIIRNGKVCCNRSGWFWCGRNAGCAAGAPCGLRCQHLRAYL